jgi:class I fructose-bisphosphate aldolase
MPSVTGSVSDALRLGCVAVGFTIYPGSSHCNAMYEQLREIAEDAKDCGLAVVVWSYPRGSVLSKEGETAIDVVAYAAQLRPSSAPMSSGQVPTAHLEQARRRRYESAKIRSRPWRSGSSMWCKARSMGAGSSFFRRGQERGQECV